jgi:methionyl-tRNA synthetase/tRNA-binding protein
MKIFSFMEENLLDIEYFRKLDIKTAKVTECEKIEKSRSLLRLTVDLGGETKQVVSSIASSYRPDDLIGKTIIVVTNLKPATFMGHKSEAMLLAAEDEGSLSLLTTFSEIKPGTEVH